MKSWESPSLRCIPPIVIDSDTLNLPFYFVALPADFSGTIGKDFQNHFYFCDPRPTDSDKNSDDLKNRFLGIFAADQNGFLERKKAELNMHEEQLKNATKPLYLNTHGFGVPYLHFRADASPTYYGDVTKLGNQTESDSYYRTLFE